MKVGAFSTTHQGAMHKIVLWFVMPKNLICQLVFKGIFLFIWSIFTIAISWNAILDILSKQWIYVKVENYILEL